MTLKKAGVAGSPISQSLSPIIHHEWANRENNSIFYDRIDISREKTAFISVIKNLIQKGYNGINVTMPHKEHALAIADHVSADAKLAGAANMLTFQNNGIYADNSDIIGFQNALRAQYEKQQWGERETPKTALVLGAGGAAKGVIIALIKSGISKILISNRTASKVETLIENLVAHFDNEIYFEQIDWEKRETAAAEILVNTTSLGMNNMPTLTHSLEENPALRLVADIVYNPLMTDLLKSAVLRNLPIVDGLDMLMYQAVPGYEQWLGGHALVDKNLRNLLTSKLDEMKSKKQMKVLGLTGSIGMGKSTVTKMFAQLGCAVWDADKAVHALYSPQGAAAAPIKQVFPDVIIRGGVDRNKLSVCLQDNPEKIKSLEKIVHPLVAMNRAIFLDEERKKGSPVCLLDIPLLLEGGNTDDFDKIIVVSALPEIQQQRVLARANMTKDKFEFILAKQMPDHEKKQHADYIIDTGISLEETRAQVAKIYSEILY